MDSRGGCCIANYGDGGGGGYDISTVNRIMMKFRPIAPKPPNRGTSSSSPEMTESTPKSGRGRRRCNNRKRKDKTDVAAVTLPLLPESPDRKSSPPPGKNIQSTWISFGSKEKMMMLDIMPQVIGSCVTVECVTADVDGGRIKNLEGERCPPGFISDTYGNVTWTNEAYKKMVVMEGEGEVVVRLEIKDKAGGVAAALASKEAFTCRVRVQNGREKSSSSITLPCDVWRLENGYFAWRLDVAAALSLGR